MSEIRQIYPPKLDGFFLHRQVYQTTRFSPLDNDDMLINQKIKYAFTMLNDTFPLKGIIFQFWAPIRTTTGKLLLSTSVQPFAFASLNRRLRKYRNSSVKSRYTIYDNNIKVEEEEEEERLMIINGGLPAAAFLKRFPQVVFDLKSIHHTNPLLAFAFKCDLTCSLMLPVFYQTSSCVGVVECSMNLPGLPLVFNHLKDALKSVGLSIYHLQGIQHTTFQIENALDMLCESQDFTLGQVIDDDDDDDDHVIVALYKDDATLFLLPSSSTLSLAKEKINQDFCFHPSSTYNLQYEANDGQWFTLNDDDASFKSCIFFRRITNKNHVKLRVHMLH